MKWSVSKVAVRDRTTGVVVDVSAYGSVGGAAVPPAAEEGVRALVCSAVTDLLSAYDGSVLRLASGTAKLEEEMRERIGLALESRVGPGAGVQVVGISVSSDGLEAIMAKMRK